MITSCPDARTDYPVIVKYAEQAGLVAGPEAAPIGGGGARLPAPRAVAPHTRLAAIVHPTRFLVCCPRRARRVSGSVSANRRHSSRQPGLS
jgi:hypothetical protein